MGFIALAGFHSFLTSSHWLQHFCGASGWCLPASIERNISSKYLNRKIHITQESAPTFPSALILHWLKYSRLANKSSFSYIFLTSLWIYPLIKLDLSKRNKLHLWHRALFVVVRFTKIKHEVVARKEWRKIKEETLLAISIIHANVSTLLETL